MHYVYV